MTHDGLVYWILRPQDDSLPRTVVWVEDSAAVKGGPEGSLPPLIRKIPPGWRLEELLPEDPEICGYPKTAQD
ncbi:MAG: hypothetical protein ACE5F1_17695 [Planctomycetota bacterium]